MSRRGVRMNTVPKSIGPGRVLCHSHVQHTVDMPSSLNGFRGWTDKRPPANFVSCPCGWSGLPHFARRDHVEVMRTQPAYLRWTVAELLAWQHTEMKETAP